MVCYLQLIFYTYIATYNIVQGMCHIFKLGAAGWCTPGFLELLLSANVCMCVCVCMCLPLTLLITSSMTWTPYDWPWSNKFLAFVWQLWSISIVGMEQAPICIAETSPTRVRQYCISHNLTVTIILNSCQDGALQF